jgi:prevent-host-death family protein
MRSVTIQAAREHFAEIVEGALKGSTTVITRRGKDVAVVAPLPRQTGPELPDLAEFRAVIRVKGKPLSHVATEQRRRSRY